MPAEQEVVIVIIGKDAASKIFKQIGKSAEEEGKKVEKSFAKSLENVGKAATSAGKKLSIGVTAPLGIFAGVAVDSAMKADRLQRTLEGLAGGADAAAGYINAIKTASQGTVPQVEALAIANRALSFGVVETADEMAALTEIAIALGRAQGLDAATAVSDLTTALSRQSPMILDNLGITIKAGDANKAYAAQLGISTDALTAEQKAIAFRTAALEKGKAVVAAMGGVQDDMAASGERVKAQMADMALTVGQALIPILQQTLDIVGPLIKGFTEMDPAMQKVVIAMAAGAAAAGPLLTAFGTLAQVVAKIPTSMAALKTALSSTNAQMLALTGVVVAGAAAWQAYQNLQGEVARGQEQVNQALSTWSDVADEVITKGGTSADVIAELARRGNEAAQAYEKAGFAAKLVVSKQDAIGGTAAEANRQILRVSSTFEEYQANLAGYNAQVGDSILKVSTQADVQERARVILEKNALTMTEAQATMQALAETTTGLTEAQFNLRMSYVETGEAILESAQNTAQAIVEAQNLKQESLDLAGATQLATRGTQEQAAARDILATRMRQTGIAAAESAAAEKVAAEEAAAAAEEHASALAEMAAQAQAAAVEQTNLAARMKDATDQQIAQALISQLDPEQLGATAYSDAVTDIQVAFGLADEKSIALAQNISTLSDAINEGIVPPEKAAEALTLMHEAAATGDTNVAGLIAKFEAVPEPVDRAKLAIDDTSDALKDVDTSAVEAGASASDFGANAAEAAKDAQTLRNDVDDTTEALIRFAQDYTATVTIEYVTIGSPPAGAGGGGITDELPRRQFGGIVPGPIGRPQLVMAHGGEVVLNPHQPGALGGPGGPTIGGDTYQVTINDELAAAMFLAEQRQRRFERLNARM